MHVHRSALRALGILSDRYGRRKFAVAGSLNFGVSVAVLALTKSEPILLPAEILGGASDAAFTPSVAASLADTAGIEEKKSLFLLHRLRSA
jgi:MFS family permease